MRVLLRVAYDGTGYSGWQIQPNAVTVEKVLIEALEGLFGKKVEIIGASRTDAGVHAYGNVAVFDTDTKMPAEKISYALNQRLPEDVRIQESVEVEAGFHPRHRDCVKTYEYRIWNDRFESPLNRLYSHFYYGKLDVDEQIFRLIPAFFIPEVQHQRNYRISVFSIELCPILRSIIPHHSKWHICIRFCLIF